MESWTHSNGSTIKSEFQWQLIAIAVVVFVVIALVVLLLVYTCSGVDSKYLLVGDARKGIKASKSSDPARFLEGKVESLGWASPEVSGSSQDAALELAASQQRSSDVNSRRVRLSAKRPH